MSRTNVVALIAAAWLSGAGCAERAAPGPAKGRTSTSAEAPRSPLLGISVPSLEESEIDGVIRDVVRAGPYRYVEVVDGRGSARWIATLSVSAGPGDSVHVKSFGARDDFYSKRLGRRFERLLFGMVTRA